jgi:hypothetical protein
MTTDRVDIDSAAPAKFNRELGLRFMAEEIRHADGHVLIVGRVQEWRPGGPSREVPVVLLWEFEDDQVGRIRQFASKEEALEAAGLREWR